MTQRGNAQVSATIMALHDPVEFCPDFRPSAVAQSPFRTTDFFIVNPFFPCGTPLASPSAGQLKRQYNLPALGSVSI
jgi:hypothetical protein